MTFIDTPYRFAVKATCTNRKCNLSVFGGPASGFEKNVWAHVIDHPEHGGGGLSDDFYSYLQLFGRVQQMSSDATTFSSPCCICIP